MASKPKSKSPKESKTLSRKEESSKLDKLNATATQAVNLLEKTGSYSPGELDQLREVSTLATQLSSDLINSQVPQEEHSGVMDWLASAGQALLNAAPTILSIVAALL